MSFIYAKSDVCRTCKQKREAHLCKLIIQSGAEMYSWVCVTCDAKNPFRGPQYIAKPLIEAELTPEQIAYLPVVVSPLYARCARCGFRGAELNHWMPIGIVGREEADKWPQDYLCKPCHDKWHQLVTPNLVNPDQNPF